MGKRIYVGNLPPEFTADQLCALFAAYGAVTSAEVIAEKSGQSRGFGFVEMGTDEQTQEAIAKLHGRAVGGKTLVVNEARPKAKDPKDGFGRGGFGFGGRGGYGGGGQGGFGGDGWSGGPQGGDRRGGGRSR